MGAAAGLWLLPAMGHACESLAKDFQLGRQLTDSAWTEYSDNGQALVKEKGTLPGWRLAASLNCDRWTFGAEAFITDGNRNYDGQTSLGTPLTTTSAISDRSGRITVGWALVDHLQLLVDASLQRTNRTIASTPLAAGYPETYDRSLIRAGARWSVPSAIGTWTFSGAKAVTGQQTQQLQLPGKDPATLHFDTPDQWELAIGWRQALTPSLYLDVSYRYVHTTVGKSDTALITSSGLPVGAAYQPRTTVVERPIAVSMGWSF